MSCPDCKFVPMHEKMSPNGGIYYKCPECGLEISEDDDG